MTNTSQPNDLFLDDLLDAIVDAGAEAVEGRRPRRVSTVDRGGGGSRRRAPSAGRLRAVTGDVDNMAAKGRRDAVVGDTGDTGDTGDAHDVASDGLDGIGPADTGDSTAPAAEDTSAEPVGTPDRGAGASLADGCLWCHAAVPRHRGPGRPRLYCCRSHRQRAYERRRGLGVLPPPEQLIASPGGPLAGLPGSWHAYEAGVSAVYPSRKVHALRPAGIAGRGNRRATLCGLKRAPSGRAFVPSSTDTVCQTCSAIARRRPSARPLRPSSDLAAYRSQLDAIAVRLARAGEKAWDEAPGMLFELLAAA